MAYFPAFIEIENHPVLVVGGGRTALKKIEVLLEFKADITVIASEFIEEIQKMDSQLVKRLEKPFQVSDVEGMHIVVAATESKEVNHVIAEVCRERKILVNAVDQASDCTFIFPSYIKQREVVAAFSSGGKSPVVTQYLKEKNRPIVTLGLAELTERLGSLRDMAKGGIATEKMRKAFYQEVLALGLEEERVPDEKEIEEIFLKYMD